VIQHPIIPFKSKAKILEHLARTVLSEYGKNQYDLYSKNCEHFANMIIYGLNFSQQFVSKEKILEIGEDKKSLIWNLK
jgi:hypothetical protein